MFVSCECCVLSGTGTLFQKSATECSASEGEQETSQEGPGPLGQSNRDQKKKKKSNLKERLLLGFRIACRFNSLLIGKIMQ